MTARAIDFADVVETIRSVAASPEGQAIATLEAETPVEICRALYAIADDRDDPSAWEFYLSPNARREMERQLAGDDYEIAAEAYLYRLLRTDGSMPDRTVLFARPDAVALDGTVVDPSSVAVGTITGGDA